jgi:hypothetical protein
MGDRVYNLNMEVIDAAQPYGAASVLVAGSEE